MVKAELSALSFWFKIKMWINSLNKQLDKCIIHKHFLFLLLCLCLIADFYKSRYVFSIIGELTDLQVRYILCQWLNEVILWYCYVYILRFREQRLAASTSPFSFLHASTWYRFPSPHRKFLPYVVLSLVTGGWSGLGTMWNSSAGESKCSNK